MRRRSEAPSDRSVIRYSGADGIVVVQPVDVHRPVRAHAPALQAARGRELHRPLPGRRARRIRGCVPDRGAAARREGDEPPAAVLVVGDVGRGRGLDGRQDAALGQPSGGRHPQRCGHGRRDAVHALQRRADRDPAGRHQDPHLHRAGRPARADVSDRGAQAAHRCRGRDAHRRAEPPLHEQRRHGRHLPDRLSGEGAVRVRRPAGTVGPLAVGRDGAHVRRGRRHRRPGRRRPRRHPAAVQAVRAGGDRLRDRGGPDHGDPR